METKYMQCPLCNYVLYDLSHFIIHTRVIHHRLKDDREQLKEKQILLMQPPIMMYKGPTK